MYSHSILKRFVKDFSLPIQLVQEPYFEYYIDLYDGLLHTREKYDLFCRTVEEVGGEEEFFKTSDAVKESIISSIRDTKAFQRFNNDLLKNYEVVVPVTNMDVYRPDNDGKYFLSLDLKKANYNALKFYDPEIVLDTGSYEELISRFTDLDYFKETKYIRQVIFGNLNPKKQIKIQRFLIMCLIDTCMKFVDRERIRAASSDEVVIFLETPDEFLKYQQWQDALKNMAQNMGIELNAKIYLLKQLKPYSYFVKEYISGEIEFKSVPALFMPQVYKTYTMQELNEKDLTFYHEGRVARFLEPLDFQEVIS